MTPLIVIPAAGASSRMRGRDKLLEQVEGKPLLRRQAETALASGAPVMVALPPKATARQEAIAGLNVTQIIVKDAAEGLGATLRTASLFAARHAPDRAMMILLPDVPGITVFDIKTVMTRFEAAGGDTPTRATDANGTPGTPLIVPERLIAAFTKLTGDDGGKSILKGEDVLKIPLSDNRATRDLDTPEDWEAWRTET